jgi:hypothetical protein
MWKEVLGMMPEMTPDERFLASAKEIPPCVYCERQILVFQRHCPGCGRANPDVVLGLFWDDFEATPEERERGTLEQCLLGHPRMKETMAKSPKFAREICTKEPHCEACGERIEG